MTLTNILLLFGLIVSIINNDRIIKFLKFIFLCLKKDSTLIAAHKAWAINSPWYLKPKYYFEWIKEKFK